MTCACTETSSILVGSSKIMLRGGYAGIRHGVEHGWHKEPRQHADYRHDHNKLNKGEPLF